MTPAQLHLFVNHVPIIAFGIGIGLFIGGVIGRSDDLKRASFAILFVIALMAVPIYMTGNAATFILRNDAGFSPDLIAAHQDAAMLALIPMQLMGVLAWFALWRYRPWHVPAVLVLSILTFGLMARAGNLGGEIRHPEIAATGAAALGPAWPRAAAAGAALVLDHPWVWPICEIFHFVGLCMLFGVVLLVNLQMLGVFTGMALADVRRLLPWAMAGLVINIVTGMLFFLASPDQYTQNTAFAWKLCLMLCGAVTLLYPTMVDESGARKPGRSAVVRKLVAVASIVLWVGVIFLGRFLPYIGSE
jgi:uncharacterized membrane protein